MFDSAATQEVDALVDVRLLECTNAVMHGELDYTRTTRIFIVYR